MTRDIDVAAEPRASFVAGGDGRRLRVQRWPIDGSRSATLLFLHGGGLTGYTWARVATALQDTFECIAPDLRGHGESDWHPDGDYRLEAYADDVASVRAGLGIERAIVIGMSLGANVALLDVATMGAASAGLVMIDAGPSGSRPEGRDRLAGLMAVREFPSFDAALQTAAAADPDRDVDRLRRSLERNLRQQPGGTWKWRWDPRIRWRAAARSPEDEMELAEARTRQLLDAAARTTCPVLVIRGGESDMFLEADAARTAAAFADAEVLTIPGAGHAVQVDRPAELAAAIRSFADRIGLGPASPTA